jgi:hypothetical protein
VGALAVRFIKGKAVCKTEFITQFQVGVRNTWNNADNRHKLNFSPSTGRMIRTLTSRLSRRSSSSRGKPFGKRNSITQFQVTLRNTWNNTGFVKGKAVCKTEFYYSVPGDPAEHLEQRGDGGMIRSGMYSLLGFVKGKAVCKTEFITQFQVTLRNTWKNTGNYSFTNFCTALRPSLSVILSKYMPDG